MNTIFSWAFLFALGFGLYYLIRLIIAVIKSQPKDNFKKGLICCVVAVVISIVGFNLTQTPEQKAAHQAKIDAENKAKEEKRIADEKAAEEKRIEEEKQAAEIRERQAAMNEQARQEAMLREITTGWNTSITDAGENSDNWIKASSLVQKYPNYIHNAPPNWIIIEDALRKPWEFYGKVVNLNGTIYSIEQLPPNNSLAKFFGGDCYRAMLAVGDTYNPVAVSIYIVGNSDNIVENSNINVKGFIYGHEKMVNGMGGTSRGLGFVGFAE